MSAIVLSHRWLGIAFCLLFAMWFASGIVMHFVPFPSLTEAERFAGLMPVDRGERRISVADAVAASGIVDATRVRLIQRSDDAVYIVSGPSRQRAIRAADGNDASVKSADVALAIAQAHARQREIDASHATIVGRSDYDQWSVPNGFDRHRPLFRVALGDAAGTEVYVSSSTGEIALDTTRSERGWSLVGSVLHWIYPTILRSNWTLWDRVVWTLSLLALIAAVLGAVLGIVRVRIGKRQISPYRGWHALHHLIGLAATVFVLIWIFSGWLSMDHGRLFSRGQLTPTEAGVVNAAPDWREASSLDLQPISAAAREAEWFAFNGHVYRRDRVALGGQTLSRRGDALRDGLAGFLDVHEIQALTGRLTVGCGPPSVLPDSDEYPALSTMPGAPVYRSRCDGDLWFDIDGADGNVLQRLDPSRRAYRWLYSALHTLDFPILLAHPRLRDVVIVSLCTLGLTFSVTGIVIGWRRLRSSLAT
ncbi:PepSY domain-containing protein [Bradyrhizobium zhanjiangense]|uniref:PepSY domain-containing protein n=1 Tax=Bradyrhizobium zhanjiangense TaxID=1325107 RepID=UPI0010091AA0|nr:PepSY domain-containing protein [Bradyrhizobium zhanjiangense]